MSPSRAILSLSVAAVLLAGGTAFIGTAGAKTPKPAAPPVVDSCVKITTPTDRAASPTVISATRDCVLSFEDDFTGDFNSINSEQGSCATDSAQLLASLGSTSKTLIAQYRSTLSHGRTAQAGYYTAEEEYYDRHHNKAAVDSLDSVAAKIKKLTFDLDTAWQDLDRVANDWNANECPAAATDLHQARLDAVTARDEYKPLDKELSTLSGLIKQR